MTVCFKYDIEYIHILRDKNTECIMLNLSVHTLTTRLYRVNGGCVWPVRFSLYTSSEKMNKVPLWQLI
jgi:hypothetical protein